MVKKIDKIVDGAFAFGTIQNYTEIYNAVKFIIDRNITNFLEIGTNEGGTFYCWTCCSRMANLSFVSRSSFLNSSTTWSSSTSGGALG